VTQWSPSSSVSEHGGAADTESQAGCGGRRRPRGVQEEIPGREGASTKQKGSAQDMTLSVNADRPTHALSQAVEPARRGQDVAMPWGQVEKASPSGSPREATQHMRSGPGRGAQEGFFSAQAEREPQTTSLSGEPG